MEIFDEIEKIPYKEVRLWAIAQLFHRNKITMEQFTEWFTNLPTKDIIEYGDIMEEISDYYYSIFPEDRIIEPDEELPYIDGGLYESFLKKEELK